MQVAQGGPFKHLAGLIANQLVKEPGASGKLEVPA